MNKILFFLFISIASLTAQIENQLNFSENIRINQVGYFSNGIKQFIAVDVDPQSFELIDIRGRSVFKGELKENGFWEKSGEKVLSGDFTEFMVPGKFRVKLKNGLTSYPFEIGNNIYDGVKTAALKSYYLQRVSMPIEPEFGGIYERPLGHEDLQLEYHASSGQSGNLDSPGGWYDAGDYGKYIINAGIATGIMLALAEKYPNAYPDGSLNIPESGNGIPDVLDELKYEIDWMLTMQDTDGGVFVKVTTLNFCGMVMPDEAPKDRKIIGKSTAAALHIAAIGSMAARIYEPYDKDFALRCHKASLKAWVWAKNNPEVYYAENPSDVKTGAYNDTDLNEELFWAAAELYVSTKEDLFLKEIDSKLGNITFRPGENWRNYNDNIGYYSLLQKSSPLSSEKRKIIEKGILSLADSIAENHQKIPYQIPVEHFVWGSNSDILDAAIIFTQAYEINNDRKFLDLSVQSFDYILGKNATGYSFVTGYGSKTPLHIHHRPSEADNIESPYPGFLVGGPNYQIQDKTDLVNSGFSYASTLPAKSYIDALPSFASNEICINWNAPCVYMLGFFDAHKKELNE